MLNLPKSVKDSQKFVAWGFPCLLVYGVVSLPVTNWVGQIALIIGSMMVITGWFSFGVIEEVNYNDLLLMIDLSLLAMYWLLLFYSRHLTPGTTTDDAILYNLSGTTFFLYGLWDLTALSGRDTAAIATALHLSRFAWITFVTGLAFFGLGILSLNISDNKISWTHGLRIFALGIWLFILIWWQIGRFIAALTDAGNRKT